MPTLINVYSTLLAPPAPDFPHTLVGRRDLSDPELSSHLDGFAGYIQSRGDGQMTQTRYHVLLHIQRVRHQFSLNVEDAHVNAFADWAWRANGVCFTPDGAVRDPDGRVLIDASGATDPQSQVPYPADAIDRKARTDASLASAGIHTPATLPTVAGLEEVDLRAASDVARRFMALFIPNFQAGTLSKRVSPSSLQSTFPIGFAALTPTERDFIFAASPSQQEVVNFNWRSEAMFALQWAIGLFSELPWPSQTCDAVQVERNAIDNDNEDFLRSAHLRPAEEILDAFDLHYRLHWAVREAHRQEQPLPAQLDPGVIGERHHALNWLVRFGNDDWDDVDTPT